MSESVVIVGAGQLGSRYLQGFSDMTRPLDLFVIDPRTESLQRSESRWHEVAGQESRVRVTFATGLNTLPSAIDLAIVATTADVRPTVVMELARKSRVSHWVIEKVLAQDESGVDAIEAAVGGAKAWVNTPRRIMPWYQQLKSHLPVGQPITVEVVGGAWGLACNAVHYLDLIEWWAEETLIAVETGGLKPQWITAKRPGFSEVTGTLVGRFSGGSQGRLTVSENTEPVRMRLHTGGYVWVIDQAEGTAYRSDNLQLLGTLVPQSRLTADLTESILATGDCGLPSLGESARLHRVYLRSMISHRRNHTDSHSVSVPIT
jgi:predicted dehydrogenase